MTYENRLIFLNPYWVLSLCNMLCCLVQGLTPIPVRENTVLCVQILVLYKNTNHQQMRKESFIINRNTLLHVSALLGHLQGELFVTVTLRLHLQLSENVLLTVYCVVFGGVNCLRSGLEACW
jgi:hypothetical protein